MGSIVALLFVYKKNIIYRKFIILSFFILFLISLSQYDLDDKFRTVWDVLVIGIPIAGIVYFMIDLEQKNRFIFPKFLQSIGNASYSIYLSHVLVLTVVGRVWISLPESLRERELEGTIC
jgi:peptidoglycan/LPS O-acetylase OafA/YrhL